MKLIPMRNCFSLDAFIMKHNTDIHWYANYIFKMMSTNFRDNSFFFLICITTLKILVIYWDITLLQIEYNSNQVHNINDTLYVGILLVICNTHYPFHISCIHRLNYAYL